MLALAAYAGDDRLALDFHHELYRQAEAVADGRDAYDSPDADLSDRANFVWPMAAVLPVVPLTALPPGVADWLATAVVLASLVAALWLLSVRDWRVYGVVLLWPAVIEAMQTANASLPLTLLVALMWRYRDRRRSPARRSGYAVAVKLFLWPLVVWLALVGRRSRRRHRRGGRGGLAAPAAPVHEHRRLRAAPSEPRRDLRARGVHAVRAAHGSRRARTPRRASSPSPSASPCSRSRGAVAAWGSRSPPRSSSRRSSGVTSSSCCSCRSRSRVHGSTSCGSFPSGMWVGDGTFNGAPWQTACVLGARRATFVALRAAPRDPATPPCALGEPASLPI